MKYTLLLAIAIGSALGATELQCKGRINARLPPSKGPSNPKFKDTPRGFFAGQWYQTYSSVNDSTLGFGNLQLISSFDEKADVTSDITSFKIGKCAHIFTIFAQDQHVKTSQGDDFPLVEPGTNITHLQDIVAYGSDTHCHRYFVVYGRSPGTPGLVISSQIQNGPSSETVAALKTAFENLGNEDIARLGKQLALLPDDGSRQGLADFVCDHACMVNKNQPPADGSCPSA